ncbi:MAG: hypothetical protein KME28_26975 [Pelatocladus maniniholoensis HA4357-MV3]|jgi:hypothetical protein|uniref:Uncharacterized protein n=1 Tax=Pelatocladus maniniholoensis HA4357-MV3 TaxID=1117104 RepID=A0A9E3HDG6_9NOST|nr:hypothetical protein [Pelatocladus maniniholoensis HA4357-MV3]
MAIYTQPIKSTKKARELAHNRSSWEREYEAVNVEALKGILSYFKYLYAEGEISDKAYEALVSQALSTFVKNTISLKIETMFDEIDVTFKQASEALLTKILV